MPTVDLEVLRQRLRKIAGGGFDPAATEDFCPYSWYGGNMDDAYQGGVEVGERLLAVDLLKEFFGEEVSPAQEG